LLHFLIVYSWYSKACQLPSVAGAVVVVEIVNEINIYIGKNLVLMVTLKCKQQKKLARRINDKERISNASAPPPVPIAINFNVFDPFVVAARNNRHLFSVHRSWDKRYINQSAYKSS